MVAADQEQWVYDQLLVGLHADLAIADLEMVPELGLSPAAQDIAEALLDELR